MTRPADQGIFFREHDAFGGLRQLLNGFCDPRRSMEDDDNEPGATSTENLSIKPRSQSKQARPTKDESDRKAPSITDTSVDSKEYTEIFQKDEEKWHAQREDLQEPNCLQHSSIRSTRRSQVVLFAFAAVILTIYALSSLGFTMDFAVIESQKTTAEPKNLINIGMAPKKGGAETKVEHAATSRDEMALESLEALKELVAEIKAM
ncbi:unnamed protein product [Cylindrotheca closterium]|uniref:Uncharacterized protein n=1 Tax=Cylindrotheca closterium TaxID=2856 RepID=A0AAD2CQL4_9STRA|nr:unnamed protein product [Cylindrotheca closterium]